MIREILVIRKPDVFTRILSEQGFSATNFPLLKTEALADLSELESCLENLEVFDGIFITSRKAAEVFLEIANNKTFGGKFYVFGNRSKNLLETAGYETFFVGDAKTASQFLETIPQADLRGKKFLFLRGNRSLRVVPEKLKKVAEIREAVVYQTVAIEANEERLIEIKEKFAHGKIGAICFFSPSGVEEFLKQFENFAQGDIKISAIGETTANFIEAKKLRADFVAAKPTAKDFANELTSFLRKEI